MTNLLIYGIAVVMFVIGLILFYKSISVLGKVETLKDEMCAAIGDWVGKFDTVARAIKDNLVVTVNTSSEFKATVAKWNDQLGDFRILSKALIESKQGLVDNLIVLKSLLETMEELNESNKLGRTALFEENKQAQAAINKTLDMQLELYNAFNAANVKKPRAKKE